MRAGGNFRNYPAKRPVCVILSNHGLREDLAITADQRHRAVVARGFKGKN
jgi:hypothetical protein